MTAKLQMPRWRLRARRPVIRYLTIQDVEQICYPEAQAVFTEESYKMPVLHWHDRSKMEAALGNIRNSYYHSLPDLAAALAYYICKAHSLKDGNKRIAVITMLSFLGVNGYFQTEAVGRDEIVEFIERVAASDAHQKTAVIAQAAEWITANFTQESSVPGY